MASSDLNNTHTYTKSKQQVSTMLKQGFISDFFLSPPPSSPSDPTRSTQSPIRSTPSPTLFEMMTDEHTRDPKPCTQLHSTETNRSRIEERVARVLSGAPFRNPSDWGLEFGDVKLTITARDGFSVSMDVHREVLAGRSQFFKEKFGRRSGSHHSVEICQCDDVEVYLETLVLMYCDDPKKKMMGESVSKILGLLKVCDALKFENGISSCLEYLEAVPWSEQEEEIVISHLNELNLHNDHEVLQRVTSDPSTSSRIDDIFSRLLTGVLQAKDEKARRDMKSLISRLIKDDNHDHNHNYSYNNLEISKETLYTVCHTCLTNLVLCLSEANETSLTMSEIARECDNLEWVVDILIEKRISEDFVKLWANQKDLAKLHSKVPVMYGHKVSRITAQLCIAIGRGNVLVPKEMRVLLLSTWLEALYDDFGWMKRGSKMVDRRLIEDGVSQIILTLPLLNQKDFLMSWFDRFLEKGDDCLNIQRAFEIWWRRAFVRQTVVEPQLQITVCDYPS